jgi:hypothetical protein
MSSKEIILEIILTNPGISQKDLQQKTGLSRDYIYDLTKKLNETREIKIKKHGRWVKYFPKTGDDTTWFNVVSRRQFKTIFENNLAHAADLDVFVWTFVESIGLLATSMLIESMNAKNKNMPKSDTNTIDWIEKVCDPVVFLRIFREQIGKWNQSDYSTTYQKPWFKLDDELITILHSILKKGPRKQTKLISRIDKQRKNELLNTLIEFENHVLKTIKQNKILEKQLQCSHTFINKSLDGSTIKLCTICDLKKSLSGNVLYELQ